jgi:DNA-binding PadR family transcriptional regulator
MDYPYMGDPPMTARAVPMTDDAWRFLPLTDLSFQVLLAVTDEPRHGYGVLKAIAARTEGRLEPETGTLYTAIRRLRDDGLLRVVGEGSGRRGRSYGLTPLGRSVVALESRRLAALVAEARSLALLDGSRDLL